VSGQDFAKLMMTGWVPVGLVLGISIGSRHDDRTTTRQARCHCAATCSGKPGRVPSRGRPHQCPDPLIFITPGQQLPPQFLIHAVIQLRRRPTAEAERGLIRCA
jgi:hypothetical protein